MENKLSEDADSTLCELIKEKIMPHTKQLNSKTTKTYFSIITISDLYWISKISRKKNQNYPAKFSSSYFFSYSTHHKIVFLNS